MSLRGAIQRRRAHLAVVAAVALMLTGCARGGSDDEEPESTSTGSLVSDDSESESADPGTDQSATDGGGSVTCEYRAAETPGESVEPPPQTPPSDLPDQVRLDTSAGSLTLTLEAATAPCAVNSFVHLAEQGFFDGSTCHRLTTQGLFSLQCGDPTGTGQGGPGYEFGSEVSGDEKYPRGTVAMAPFAPDNNGSQFFLIYDDSELAPKYTILGTIDEAGLEVLDAVAESGTTTGDVDGTPRTEVTIEAATADIT